MNPAVSVIIPNYNHATFLQERLDSVIHQTYTNFEVIILDDASTDLSKMIIEQYRNHPKVKQIVYNESNSGSTFIQWKKGIELALGEYIWIAESDDYCEKNFIESLINNIDKNTVIAYCQSICIDNVENIIFQSQAPKLLQIVNGKNFIQHNMLSGNTIFNASMCIWKKNTFYLISNEYLNYKFCGDWVFWSELSLFGDILISGKVLNYYRSNPTGVGHTLSGFDTIIEEEFKALKHIIFLGIIDKQIKKNLIKNKLKKFISNPHILALFKKISTVHTELHFPFWREYLILQIFKSKATRFISYLKRI